MARNTYCHTVCTFIHKYFRRSTDSLTWVLVGMFGLKPCVYYSSLCVYPTVTDCNNKSFTGAKEEEKNPGFQSRIFILAPVCLNQNKYTLRY